jgi:hypothetical protein
MRDPLDEVTQWLRRQRVERAMTFDMDPSGDARVILSFPNTAGDDQDVEGLGATLADALIAALDKLPNEVRRWRGEARR